MRSLVVEDEFTSRKILQRLLASLGECDVAVDGREAVVAFEEALQSKDPYELICLDVMLPGLDGQGVLKHIREFEATRGVPMGHGANIIMTTSLNDSRNVMGAFKGGCESYLVKPIDRTKLFHELGKLGIIPAADDHEAVSA